MKKLLAILLLVLIGLLLWSWYSSYKRSHPDQDYSYSFREDLDENYHNSQALQDYYYTGYQVGAFAREIWQSKCIDLLDNQEMDADSRAAQVTYLKMKAHADALGDRLAKSAELKKAGFNNIDIRKMEETGYAPAFYRLLQATEGKELKLTDQNKAVWKMQGKLIQKGFQMPHDGLFGPETAEGVKAFQQKNGLFPSGIADQETLEQIFEFK